MKRGRRIWTTEMKRCHRSTLWFPPKIGACDYHIIGRHVQIGDWHRPISCDDDYTELSRMSDKQWPPNFCNVCAALPWAFSRYRSDSAKKGGGDEEREAPLLPRWLLRPIWKTLCTSRNPSTFARYTKPRHGALVSTVVSMGIRSTFAVLFFFNSRDVETES